MGSLTTTAERIIRQPALTMPGNATGSEAACTALTASQIRTLLSLGTTSDVTFDIVRATTSVLSPLFKNGSAVTTLGDVTYGVSIPGTSSFGVNQWINSSEGSNRILFAPASHTYFDSPGQFLFRNAGGATYGTINAATLDHPTAALTLGNSTYGVTVPGQIAMTGSSAYITSGGEIIAGTDSSGFYFGGGLAAVNRHVNIGNLGSSLNTRILNAALLIGTTTDNGSGAKLQVAGAATFSGDISMQKATQGYIRAYATDGVKNAALYHDGTNGILSTSSGALVLLPSNGDVNIYGNHLDNASLNIPANANGLGWNVTKSATEYIDCAYGGVVSGFRQFGSVPFTISTAAVPILLNSGTNIYNFGASTNARPAIKASSTTFAIRLGDDSADAPITCAGITASDLVTIDGPTGASGGVTTLNITDGANATFRLSFENASRIMLSGNEGAHNLSFGGKSGNSGSSPFTERFRVDNVANQVVSYSPFICTSITASGLIRGAETTSTPSGTTQTITLETGNCQTLDLTSSTGDVTATLTVPASSARGSLLIKQHATTSRDITWAASSGTITWLGTEPTWNADATSAYREVEWRFNGTNTFLIPSGSS